MAAAWEDLPAGVRDAIQDHAGHAVKAEPVERGVAPGLTAVLHNTDGERFFLKATPERSLRAARLHLHEMEVGAAMPLTLPAPRMRYGAVTGGWIVTLSDYVADARHAELDRRWDLDRVKSAVGAISGTRAWKGLPPVAEHVTRYQAAAARLMATLPPGDLPDLYARALEGFDAEALGGDQLVHWDLHPGNILMDEHGQVHVTDWAFACAGAEGLDAVLLLPRLVRAGVPVADAAGAIEYVPGRGVLPVAGILALWTMFRHLKSTTGPAEHRERYVPSVWAGEQLLRYLA